MIGQFAFLMNLQFHPHMSNCRLRDEAWVLWYLPTWAGEKIAPAVGFFV
jgi:hypothetical protein